MVRGMENDMANLLSEQTNEMSLKQLERDIRVVASMMDQGKRGNRWSRGEQLNLKASGNE